MGLWDKLKGELIDIVEWLDNTNNTMVYRFERYQNEIKSGAKLVVRESQNAAFVNEGQLADIFAPGTHTLETKNLPILATLKGWKYGFNSPFKAEVYFVSMRSFTDLKWGTKNPIIVRDKEYGPIRLRTFGTYVIRVKDVGTFLKNIVGTDSRFTAEQITEDLRNQIVTSVSDAIAESGIPVLDMAANQLELGDLLKKKIQPEFDTWGLEIVKLRVENISLPPEVEAFLDKGSSMRMVGNLDQFTKFQVANSMEKAAQNPGMAGGIMGMGVGMAMGQPIGGAVQSATQPAAGAPSGGPPPIPGASPFFVAVNGQQTGPFDVSSLKLHAQTGKLLPASLVWKQGMAAWTKAGDVPELAEVFASSAPPPIPPG
jgi:membrane protease subunit (stomatin/prohibitin family)